MKNLQRIGFASLIIIALFASAVSKSSAQSNPTPFDLSTGNFSMTSWPAASSAATYPANMVFQRTGTQDPGLGVDMTSDYVGAYNGGIGSRINGLDDNGIAFLNIGTAGNIGAAVAGINTLNRATVRVTFTCQLLAQGDGSPTPREYAIRLQYRLGIGGTWTDAPGPAEYSSAGKAVNNIQTIGPIDLPIEVNNQSAVYLRWKYYSVAANSGGQRPRISLDDIFVTSISTLGSPANFAVGSITPASPSTTSSFSATIQSVDAGGNPAAVAQNTSFLLSLASGSGTLGGNLTGTIAAGNTSVIVSGITYNTAQSNVRISAMRTSGDMLGAGTSAPFSVGAGATGQAFVGLQSRANAGKLLRPFTVEARQSNGTLDPSFQGNVTIAVSSGNGTLSGTKTQPLVNGVATFNNLSFSDAGNYTISATTPGLSQATSSSIIVSPAIAMTPIAVPQYIKSASDASRLPSFALMRFDNLIPNTQYRYFTSICSTINEVGAGAGNNIHYSDENGTFFSSSAKSLTSTNIPPDYSSFTTSDGQTSKTLWVNIVTTGNARFAEGTNIYWRVFLTDAPGFPSDTLTASIPSKTLEFGQFSTNATGIYDSISSMQPKNYAVFYDNENGSGNPITTAIVESIGTTLRTGPTTGPALFFEQLELLNGSWATLIPNNLPSGIQRIEERSSNGSLVRYWTDNDGIWSGVNTISPISGLSPAINFKTPQITLVSAPANGSVYCANGTGTIAWKSRGVQSVRLELYKGSELPLVIADNISGSAQTYQWTISGITDSSRIYQIRVNDIEHGTAFGSSAPFSIFIPPVITQDPVSVNTCVGDNIRLITQARGTGIKYQWQKDGIDIPGANDTTLFLNNSTTLTSGLYRCIVTGNAPCSQAVSRISTVFVTPPIKILKQPEFKPAAIGSRVELSVDVMGTENHKYQWRRGTQNLQNSTRISGVHSPTLIIHNFHASDVGSNYNCVISGNLPCGTAVTQSGGFRESAIQFSTQPDSALGCVGSSVQFHSVATSNQTGIILTYQWIRNNEKLQNGQKYQGVGSNTLTIQNITPSDTGSYWVAVFGPGNAAVESRRAILTVGSKATITEQPQSGMFCPLENTTLRIAALSLSNVSYQWYQDSIMVQNATADTLNVTAPDSSDRAKIYYCVISTSCGIDTSRIAVISTFDKPIITEQPEKILTTEVGGGIYLYVRYTAKRPVKFQWFKGNTPIDGAQYAELRLINATLADSGDYRCAIIGKCDTTLSEISKVKISLPSGVTNYENMGYYIAGSTPNPANESIKIRFGIGKVGDVSVKLLEMTGREILEQKLGDLSAGEHVATIDISNLAVGLYFCRIEAQGIMQILPISIIR